MQIIDSFYDGVPSTRSQANPRETLWLEATYEIFQTNYNDDCKKYSKSYNQSFDACKFEAINKKIYTLMNCSVPFIFKPDRTVPVEICQNVTVAQRAFDIYKEDRKKIIPECPVPSVNMITSFGYPIIEKREDSIGKVSIFFKNVVKVTNDFISYDLLRYNSIFAISYFIYFRNFSMVAEIGGYSGLLIGFSVMDLAVVLKSSMVLLRSLTTVKSN